MSLYHSPRVITNGLVTYLDAANGKSALNSVEVLVVAGGGGGGTGGGGGGGGGVLYSSNYSVTPGSAVTVTVGNGGTNTSTWGANGGQGGNSVFGNLTAIGGGAGGHRYSSPTQGLGGSGGGNAGGTSGSGTVTMANGTAGQGFTGGSSIVNGSTQEEPGGGGGGAGGPGANSTAPVDTTNAAANSAAAGVGGIGVAYDISGTLTYYAGGGGGSNRNGVGASGGLGGGGAGGSSPVAGTNGLGGGGGGTGYAGYGGGGTSAVGGSGVVIVRYPGPQRATGGTVTSANNYTIHTFSSVGTTSFTPNTWYDLSPSRNSGAINNGPTFTQGQFTFDGSNDNITLTNSASLKNNNITIEIVLKNNGTINGDIIQFGVGSGNYCQYYFRSFSGNTYWDWFPQNSAFYGEAALANSNFPVGVWKHVVLTGDNNSYVQMFLDTVSVGGPTRYATPALSTWTPADLTIGGYTWDGYTTLSIGMVKIYDRVLSYQEILQNFQAVRGRFGI